MHLHLPCKLNEIVLSKFNLLQKKKKTCKSLSEAENYTEAKGTDFL